MRTRGRGRGADPTTGPLPFVDERARVVGAPPEEVWDALERHVRRAVLFRPGHPLPRLLGAEPVAGFAVAERVAPLRLRLVGRHRFAEYALEFVLERRGAVTRLRARSFARFPGWTGRLYRAVVIGSGVHGYVVRRLLRAAAQSI